MSGQDDQRRGPRLATEPVDAEGARRLARALAADETAPLPEAPPRRPAGWFERVYERFAPARGSDPRARNEGGSRRTAGPEELELQRRLVAELLALEEPLRGTIVRRFHHGRSVADIAREDGTTEAVVRAREQRGIEVLRERLDRRHGGNRAAWAALFLRFAGEAPAPRATAVGIGGALWIAAASALVVVAVSAYLARSSPSGADEVLASSAPDAFPGPGAPLDGRERSPAARTEDAGAPRASARDFTGVVRGRFVDEDGAPIAGATVQPRADELGFRPAPPSRSGADGRFELTLVAAETKDGWHGNDLPRYVQLDARRAGHAPALCKVVVPGDSPVDLGEVVLPRAGAVSGRVVDGSGRPLAGVECVAATPDLDPAERARFPRSAPPAKAPLARATTDADGRFTFDALPVGFVRVFAAPRGHEPIASATLEVAAGARLEAGELVSEADSDWIAGVVRRADGAPLPRSLLLAVDHDSGRAPRLLTADEAGTFGLRASATLDLHALGTARAPAEGRVLGVAPGTTNVVVAADSEPSTALRLRGRDGPIEGWLTAEWELLPGTTLASFGGKSRDGRLAFPRLPIATRVTVRAERYATASVELPAALGPGATRELELASAALLTGRVVDEAGQPVPGATVLLEYPADEPVEGGLEGSFLERSGVPNRVVMTGPDGSFLLAREHPLPYLLVVHDRSLRRSSHGPFAPGAAREGEPRELVLGPFARIEGRVLVGPGDVVERKRVVASIGDGLVREAVPRPDGRFALEGLSPGLWRLWADELLEGEESVPYPPCARTSVLAAVGRTTDLCLDLTPDAPCSLTGRIALEGVPTRAWTLAWSLPGVDEARATRTPIARDGRFRARVSPARRTWFRAASDGTEAIARRIEWFEDLAPGERSLALELPTGALQIEQPDWAGRELAHVVRLARPAGEVEVETRVRLDARGHAERVLVPAGTGRLVLVRADGERADDPGLVVTVERGQNARVEPSIVR